MGGWDNGAVRGEEGERVVFRAEDGGIVREGGEVSCWLPAST